MADFRRRVVKVGGSGTWYLSAGSGPPLVLLHGGGESSLTWRWVLPRLAERFSVLAPDFLGSGESDLLRGRYSVGLFGQFVADFLDAVQVGRAAVVGHSLGGLAALQFALASQDRVSALALVASAGLGRDVHPILQLWTLPAIGEWGALWALTPWGQLQRLGLRAWACFDHPGAVPAGWFTDQLWLGQRAALLWDQLGLSRSLIDGDGQRELVLDRLAELETPTLIVWGACDRIIPPAHAHDAARRLRRCQLTVIPDCGHMPHVERPEPFLDVLQRFLSDGAQRPSPFPFSDPL
jgi:4,5:9,10-diseco-3-hydroxy-5,9,17-trioxoandrosta-1(10),2-diene-4-oate hydrolase